MKCSRALVMAVAAMMMILGLLPTYAADRTETVTVTPEETNEILANPGMGWETGGRAADEDENLPSWIPSTIRYNRWGWKVLEPEQGKIDYEFLDGVLKKTRQAGQQLAFRVMCSSPYQGRPYHPEWLTDIGGAIVETRYDDRVQVKVPVLDNPAVLAAHLDFIERLGQRYDGHPDIVRVEIGSVGWWGEWHMGASSHAKMPTMETRRKIVDAYFAAFQKTPLMMLIGGGEMLRYAVQKGAGWRADSLGDLGTFSPTWNHMHDSYPQRVQEIADVQAWKHGPISFEPPASISDYVSNGSGQLRWIFNYGLALHGSSFSGKSGRLPEDKVFKEELERFLRRLGYRLVLKELQHPRQVKANGSLKIATKWQNNGSAPCYRPYRLAYRLTNRDGYVRTLVSRVSVDEWMPGEIELFTKQFFEQPADLPPGPINKVVDTVHLPNDMTPGVYSLAIGVVGEDNTKPIVQLGTEGRKEDGWYLLSSVSVTP